MGEGHKGLNYTMLKQNKALPRLLFNEFHLQ